MPLWYIYCIHLETALFFSALSLCLSQKARERLTSASSSLPDSSQPSTSGTHHLTPPSLTPHPTPHHTHSSHPSPSSHAATSTTTSEDPSSSRDPTPLLEAESAYESACSLTSEPAGPSHHLNRGEVGASHHTPNRGEVGASPMPQVAEQGTSGRRQGPSTRRERGERRGLEDTQPLNCTPTREETSQGQRAQSSLRCAFTYAMHKLRVCWIQTCVAQHANVHSNPLVLLGRQYACFSYFNLLCHSRFMFKTALCCKDTTQTVHQWPLL